MADKDPKPGGETDPKLDLKKRARRRLVGAIALALLAVIILPMVMDQEPRPVAQDILIRIPSQEPGAHSVVSRIAPSQAATPLKPTENKSDLNTAGTAPPVSSNVPAALAAPTGSVPVQPKTAVKPETRHEAKPTPKLEVTPETSAPTKPAEKTVEKHTEAPAEKAKTGEAARAAALLNDEHWVIQLGAYQDQGNVRSLQAKLKELGYTSFTEKVDTSSGPRIRVRCGPFPSHEAALKAQARLKKIGAGGPGGGSVAQAK